jgi:hypothetical protein
MKNGKMSSFGISTIKLLEVVFSPEQFINIAQVLNNTIHETDIVD